MKKLLRALCIGLATIATAFSLVACESPTNETNTTTTKPTITTPKKPTISFQANGGSTVHSIQTDILSAPPATKKNDCLFLGWFLDKSLTTPVTFPFSPTENITLYASWQNLVTYRSFQGTSIKNWEGHYPSVYYDINPSGYDLDLLSSKNYYIEITASYDVYYKRDYDLPVGYAGAPKYEVSILDSKNRGQRKKNLETTKTTTDRSISYITSVADIKYEKLTLNFSTENIQNIIYFKNIKVTYRCRTN